MSKKIKKSTSLEYIAGYLDGEGCFTFAGKTLQSTKILVTCETTYKPVIEIFHEMFGGSYTELTRKGKINWRNTYKWTVVCRDAEKVCLSLIPYLIEKKEQAKLLLTFQKTISKGGKRLPNNIWLKRQELVNKVKILKGRL